MTYNQDSIHITEIREDLEYPGQRIKIESRLGNIRLKIQIDIGFGDSIFPAPIEIDYPTLLDMPSPHIRAYPLETVVSEKLETIVSKGIVNSRMKDFFDLRILAKDFTFEGEILAEAIKTTFSRRDTPIPSSQSVSLTDEFSQNPEKQIQWKAYLRTNNLGGTDWDLSDVIEDIRKFLIPPLVACRGNKPFTRKWFSGGLWK